MPDPTARLPRALTADRPQGAGGPRLVPILGPSCRTPRYALLRADAGLSVEVAEVGAAGRVSEVRVRNGLDAPLFLMDGQGLAGAMQDRVLTADVLVPARAGATVPVCCVEAGRWGRGDSGAEIGAHFGPGRAAGHRLRAAKASRVHDSLRSGSGHDGGQAAVWEEVVASLSRSGAASTTQALSEAYARRDAELADVRQSTRLPDDAVGLAALVHGRFLGLDLFDRHSTLAHFWPGLIDSYVLDLPRPAGGRGPSVVGPASGGDAADVATVLRVIDRVAGGDGWERYPSPGEGEDWRLRDEGLSASALLSGNVVVHLQAFGHDQATTAG